jgi:hypothetical protein
VVGAVVEGPATAGNCVSTQEGPTCMDSDTSSGYPDEVLLEM